MKGRILLIVLLSLLVSSCAITRPHPAPILRIDTTHDATVSYEYAPWKQMLSVVCHLALPGQEISVTLDRPEATQGAELRIGYTAYQETSSVSGLPILSYSTSSSPPSPAKGEVQLLVPVRGSLTLLPASASTTAVFEILNGKSSQFYVGVYESGGTELASLPPHPFQYFRVYHSGPSVDVLGRCAVDDCYERVTTYCLNKTSCLRDEGNTLYEACESVVPLS